MAIVEGEEIQNNFIAKISQSLISMDNIEDKISKALSLFGENFNASRVYIFEDDISGKFCNNSYEWCNTGIAPQIDELQNFPYEAIPSWQKILDDEGVISASNIHDLPRDLIEALEVQNIKSIYVLPLHANNKRIGFWGFDYCNHNHIWTEKEINLIQILGGLLSATFERTLNLKALNKSKDEYRLLTNNLSDIVWKYDLNLTCTYISPAVYKIRGYTVEEALTLKQKENFPEDSLQLVKKVLSEKLKQIEKGDQKGWDPFYLKLKLYKKDKTQIWTQIAANLVKDENGNPKEVVGSTRDITKQENAKMALAENEKRFRTIFEKSTDPITIIKNEEFIDCNNSTLKVLKIKSKKDFIKLKPWDISPEYQPDGKKSRAKAKQMIDKAYATGFNQFDWVHIDKLGNPTWFNVSLTKIELSGETLLHTSWRDISKRKEAEKIIRENEGRLKQIFNAAQVGIVLTVNRKLVFANQYIRDWFGYSDDELKNQLTSFVYSSKNEYYRVGKRLSEGVKNNSSVIQETELKTKKGKIVNAIVHSAYYNEKNKDEGIISVITDITDQKKNENTLRQSEKRFKKLFESSNMAIFLVDDGKIVDCNRAALELFKYNNKSDILDKHPWELSPEFQPDGSRSDDMTIVQPIIEESKKRTHTINWIHQDSKGRNFPAEITFSPIVLDGKTYIFEYIRDASIQEKLKVSETQLKKANADKDKFISILGHDIASSIGGSISIINLLEAKGSDWNKRDEFVQHIFENTRVGFELVKKIVTWGKASLGKEMFSPKEFNLHEIIKAVYKLYKTQFTHKNLSFTFNCPENFMVFADMNMIEVIIRNLVKNSIKYTNKGGQISCDIKSTNELLKVTVSDTGIGMSSRRADSLFLVNNIFSEDGTEGEKGTGLGLQIVKEYVAAHNGKIWVESKQGVGSTFIFTIPKQI